MRAWVLLPTLAWIAHCAAGSTRIDGVLVSGRLDEVSRADIREAIAANGPVTRPRLLEVVNSQEMHAYYGSRDLGWKRLHPAVVRYPDGHLRRGWDIDGLAMWEPKLWSFIKESDHVYIFPVANPQDPRRDDKHLRRLGLLASREIVRLLGDEHSWWDGGFSLIAFDSEPEPPNIGLVFQRGAKELVLFFRGEDYVEGTLNGESTNDLLNNDRVASWEQWKKRYAKPELAAK